MSSATTAFEVVKGLDLEGEVFVVTGGYSGLGAASTEALLRAGATVVVAGRNAKTQANYIEDLTSRSDLKFAAHQLDGNKTLDLASLASVREFADYVVNWYDRIHCLVNTAGVMYTPAGRTEDGFEIQMGTNAIGHFLLAKLLADKTARQVWLSSKAHTRHGAPGIDIDAIGQVDERNYSPTKRYQQSKLATILLAKQFAIEYPHLRSVSVHPGVVKTNLSRHSSPWLLMLFALKNPLTVMSMKTPDIGAATQILVATMPRDELENGAYYANCQVAEEASSARDMQDAKRFFDYCDVATRSFQE